MTQTTPSAPQSSPPASPGFESPRQRLIHGDSIMHGLSLLGGLVILVMLAGLLFVLITAAVPSMKKFGWSFLTGRVWQPNEIEVAVHTPDGKVVKDADGEIVTQTIPAKFGALPVIFGTIVSSAIALVLAVPLSFGAAMFLVRIAPRRLVAPVSFLIEFLAAIPSIAYGIWGMFVLTPFLMNYVERGPLQKWAHTPLVSWLYFDSHGTRYYCTGSDMLCGGLVLAIMIIPIITAISRDILRAVPRAQVEGTIALGATWWQSATEMFKFSRSGLFGAVMLGLARAAGETMAVTMVIGNTPRIALSLFSQAQTMASLLASKFVEAEDLERSALLEVGLILLIMSLVFNVVARWLVVGKDSRSAAAH